MNETIRYFIQEIEQQYADMVTLPTAEMQAQLAQMEAHATRLLNVAIVCSSIAFVLAITVASLMIWKRLYKDG